VATYAIELSDSCFNCLFENNIIRYAGGGGIEILNGSDNQVINNHIHHCGRIFFGGTGVVNPKGIRTRIAHNHIHDMPYCGVRGGDWNESLYELIEGNHIHHVMTMLNDGACVFNSGIGTVIRNNLCHDSYGYSKMGWGLYLDHYRTKVRMENNVVYNTRSGGLHLHDNYGNSIVNNVFAFAKDLQISIHRFHGIVFSVRQRKYRHPLQIFQRNIVYWDEGVFSYNMDCNRLDLASRPELFDYNVYYNAAEGQKVTMGIGHGGEPGYDSMECWQELGLDEHSLEVDPLFVDPKNGDFRLLPGSPAFKLGIKSIDASEAGLLHDNIGPQY
jgi:parallel beta-helix repeat protein